MRSFRLVLIVGSLSALPFILGGCGSSTMSNPSSPSSPSPSSPGSSNVAYVYVGSNPTSCCVSTQIVAYAAGSNGQLTPVPGSPFNQNVGSMAATSAYLLATANTGSDINTYTIGSNGALALGPQFDYSQIGSQVSGTCGMGVDAFDRTGQSLYTEVTCASGTNYDDLVASFAFDSSNGTLSYLGDTGTGLTSNFPALTFLGNDDYAYQVYPTGCSTFVGGGVFSFARSSSGLLNETSYTSPTGPSLPSGATAGAGPFGYVAGPVAADTANHVAMVEDACFSLGDVSQPVQLATYTANSDGSLTTTDTYATMPSTTIDPGVLAMSPSGTLLAVGGSGGLQIFNFNGSTPITSLSGVLTTDYISEMLWDSSNHLYALAPFEAGPGDTSGPGKLHVFSVTSSGATEAPGSPSTIQNPSDLAVAAQVQ